MKDLHRKPHPVSVALVGLLVLCVVAGLCVVASYRIAYQDRIYPGVSVCDLDVGALTVKEATRALIEGLPNPTEQILELRADDHTRRLGWSEAGQGFDYAATAATAFQVARGATLFDEVTSAWQIRSEGHHVKPVVIPADPELVNTVLEEMAAKIAVAPVDAQLQINSQGVVSQPGRAGRELAVAISSEHVLRVLADQMDETLSPGEDKSSAEVMVLPVSEVPPDLAEPEPANTLARTLLESSFVVVADDLLLTDFYAEFAAPTEQVATWLQVTRETTSGETKLDIEFNEAAIRSWLAQVGTQLGPERLLALDETVARVVTALREGTHLAQALILHSQTTYIVQPGDVLYDIAYVHGFPHWRLEQANPDVDPDVLLIGMELTIPSIDVLFPEPLVPGKRIDVDLWGQRVHAYEDEELVFDFTCSSGITSTPTLAGQFQVLFKEDVAFASKWSLDMPYFLAIHQEGPGFYNGIHQLPIRADGSRLWAGSLGWPASYGCIILGIEDAKELCEWAPVGTYVQITGMAPDSPVLQEDQESSVEE